MKRGLCISRHSFYTCAASDTQRGLSRDSPEVHLQLLSPVPLPMQCGLSDEVRCRQTYSPDLRERVVYQRMTLGYKIDQIATSLRMPRRVVERVLKFWRETGEVCGTGPGRSGNRSRIMDAEEMEVSASLLFCISIANTCTCLCPVSLVAR